MATAVAQYPPMAPFSNLKRPRDPWFSQVDTTTKIKRGDCRGHFNQAFQRLLVTKASPTFPIFCLEFGIAHFQTNTNKTIRWHAPLSTAQGKALKKILILGALCKTVGFKQLEAWKYQLDVELGHEGRAKCRNWFSWYDRASNYMQRWKSLSLSDIREIILDVQHPDLTIELPLDITQGESHYAKMIDPLSQEDNELIDSHNSPPSPTDTLSSETLGGLTTSEQEWSECLACGNSYCTECDLSWLNFED